MFRAEVWLISTLFCFGIIAGMIYSWPTSTASTDSHAEPSSETAEKLLASIADVPQAKLQAFDNQMAEADRLLLAGNYRDAAKLLRELFKKTDGILLPAHVIRLALADELSGNLKYAEPGYVTVMRESDDPKLKQIAMAGLSRTWFRQERTQEALELLADMVLKGSSEQTGIAGSESELLLGKVLLRLAINRQPKPIDVTNSTLVGEIPFDLEATFAAIAPQALPDSPVAQLARPDKVERSPSDATGMRPGIQVLQRPAADPDLIAFNVDLELLPISNILQQLSAAVQVPLEVDTRSSRVLMGRSRTVKVQGKSMASLLDSILLPIGLAWSLNGEKIQIETLDKFSDAESFEKYCQAAYRVFEGFSISYSDDYRAPYVFVAQGNVGMLLNDWDLAATRLQSALQTDLRGEVAAVCQINLAKINRILGRYPEAIELLYRAVDSSLDVNVQSLAFWLIADTSIQLGDFKTAVFTASRGVRVGNNPQTIEAAALTLARAYLLAGQPIAANDALYDSRQFFSDPKSIEIASVLGSYARFVGTQSSLYQKNESERLLTSVTKVSLRDDLTAEDEYLVGLAFSRLGFELKSLEVIQKGLAKTTSHFWQNRLTYEVSGLLARNGDMESALKLLDFLLEQPDELEYAAALLRKSQIELQLDHAENCIHFGRLALALELDETQKKQALDLMGQAYRNLNLPYSAALCYAGSLPSDDADANWEDRE